MTTAPDRLRQYVFVSHASDDKAAIRFIVDALIVAGIKVWLDAPGKMGYSDEEIAAHFFHLHGGDTWDKQLDTAANEAMCMVLCLSETAAARYDKVIRDEVTIGRSQQKLVACRIDGVDPARLPPDLARQQIIDLYAGPQPDFAPLTPEQQAERAKGLVNDVRMVMQRVAHAQLKAPRTRDNFLPFLVDRAKQEKMAEVAIQASAEGGVNALLVLGPENECVDQFRERLCRYTSASCLGGSVSWQEVLVDWPVDDPRPFKEAYEAELAKRLNVRTAEVRANLVRPRKAPIAAISQIPMRHWTRRERERVLDWLRYWKDIAKASAEAKIVPVLAVGLPVARPGWKKIPKAREGGVSAELIWKEAAKAEAQARSKPGEFTQLRLLEVLHPVMRDDVLTWRTRHVADTTGDLWKAIDEGMGDIFGQKDARKHGVAMKDFADQMVKKLRSKGV
jgi:hypothetical protein